MSRAFNPGGRFTSDWETNEINDAIYKDLREPAGTTVLWYVWDKAGSSVDPVYDVGAPDGVGRKWKAPVEIPVVKAVIKQGQTDLVQEGFYNSDRIHLTIERDVMMHLIPDLFDNPDPLNRDRFVWKGEVFRPLISQEAGIVLERFTILSFDAQQVMSDEMVNDPQFQAYAGSGQNPASYDSSSYTQVYDNNNYDKVS
jgi:hypothetical protein